MPTGYKKRRKYPMSVKENEELIRRYVTSDVKEVKKRITPGKDEFHSPGFRLHTPRGTVNLDAYYEIVEIIIAAFPDFRNTIDDLFGKGDKVVVRYTLSGTHKGPYMGISPTGKKITFERIIIFKVVGGKVAEAWGINDTYGLMQQLGAIPAPKK
jgi:predicted ester cyclase